ncbi:MAG: hypothetical protein H6598_06130 [Flavobacteriales bacterium]|nr:hypothetical protein [Flavobacteriales bacterium]MCB9195781.1 hypothetical protein [Flavobacteriales bacterium]
MLSTRRWLQYLLISSFFMTGMSSCISLRYTDYGRPFDFLKSKNQFYKSQKSTADTCNLAKEEFDEDKGDVHVNVPEIESNIETEELKITHEKVADISSGYVKISDLPISNKSPGSTGVFEESLTILNTTNSNSRSNIQIRANYTPWPPEWWTNMWSNFWKWVLKWLLILIAFLVVLALVIWGIYALIALIANPTVAGIVVFCIVMLLSMLIKFN